MPSLRAYHAVTLHVLDVVNVVIKNKSAVRGKQNRAETSHVNCPSTAHLHIRTKPFELRGWQDVYVSFVRMDNCVV